MQHVTIIPSKDRADYFLRYKDLPIIRFQDPIFNTKLWVSAGEVDAYRKVLLSLGLGLGHVEIIADGSSTNIAECRQSILNYCHDNNYDYLFMPDDDLKFCSRADRYRKLSMDHENNLKLFNHMSSICSSRYPLVSLRNHFMIQECRKLYSLVYTIILIYFIHVPTFVKENISFMYKGLKIYEERIVQLLLFSKGYRTCTSLIYATDQRHGDNSIGGCSAYRDIKEANKCAKIIHEDFPDYTKYTTKNNWAEGPRIVVRFNFKKFLNKGELNYCPKEEMKKFVERKEAYTIGDKK